MAKQTFERMIEKLETIVEELDSGKLPLEKALAKFEEGMALSKQCEQKLNDVEKKIDILSRTPEGKINETALDDNNDA